MPNINVEDLNIENGSNQIVGDPFEVTVHVNNRELLGPPPWKETRCMYEAPNGQQTPGHGATVEVEVLRDGSVVQSESTHVCAPTEGSGHPDPRPSWTFDLTRAGDYDVRATVDPDVHGPTSTETRTITVSPTGEQPAADDGDSGSGGQLWDDWNGGSGGSGGSGSGSPLGFGSTVDKAVLLVALLAVAWLASSASNTVEAVS